MEKDILDRIAAQDELLEKIYESTEKTRKYFMWTLIVTLAVFFLPLIGILFALPALLTTLSSAYGI